MDLVMTMICGDENSDWYDYDDGVATVDGDDDGDNCCECGAAD